MTTEELRKLNAYRHAANYLSVEQIHLPGNSPRREPPTLKHIKPRLLRHREQHLTKLYLRASEQAN